MADQSLRDQQLSLIEAAAADCGSHEFGLLLEVCGLPISKRHLLTRILEAGRWRDSQTGDCRLLRRPAEAAWAAVDLGSQPRLDAEARAANSAASRSGGWGKGVGLSR